MHSLPQPLLKSLQGVTGFDAESFEEAHESKNQITSIRINPAKNVFDLSHLNIKDQVGWCEYGYYLNERPSFTLDPVFHGGAYYVQEASSMFLHHVVKQLYKDAEQPQHVLDLCAAPGGKSTLLASALQDSFIVSNEVIKTRVTILAENISKWGSDHVVVTNNDPKDFQQLGGFFDLLVVDAPCSGSGLFRKDPGAIDEWSEANVQLCSQRQQRILADSIAALKQGGYLIYSTCSYSKDENENICDWIIEQFQLTPVAISINSEWDIVETFSDKHHAAGYRFYPGKVQGEGFFIACFQQQHEGAEYYPNPSRLQGINKREEEVIPPWLNHPDEYVFSNTKEFVVASPKKWSDEFSIIQKTLGVRKSGVAIGSIKGTDLIPHHELALANFVNKSVARIELNKEDALKYLRRQDLQLNDTQKGWTLVTHDNISLGWVKVLHNRVNNYYPTNWRILKT
jgi:16S rRNA C967 or C1407 C5-methylase (RsmB/RsmF family)/NOL1/NOP2/fmu family ribosome biogenesis protein